LLGTKGGILVTFSSACGLDFNELKVPAGNAIDLDDELDEALYVLGLTYLDKGNKDKALSMLTLYKQKYYDSLPGDLKQRLDDLIKSCKKERPW